jgi:hypothetical protein
MIDHSNSLMESHWHKALFLVLIAQWKAIDIRPCFLYFPWWESSCNSVENMSSNPMLLGTLRTHSNSKERKMWVFSESCFNSYLSSPVSLHLVTAWPVELWRDPDTKCSWNVAKKVNCKASVIKRISDHRSLMKRCYWGGKKNNREKKSCSDHRKKKT